MPDTSKTLAGPAAIRWSSKASHRKLRRMVKTTGPPARLFAKACSALNALLQCSSSTSSLTSRQVSTSGQLGVCSQVCSYDFASLDAILGRGAAGLYALPVALPRQCSTCVLLQHAPSRLDARTGRIAEVFLTDRMAAEAHKRASKVMDAATEARLAKIINSDLEQLREKAQGESQQVRSTAGVLTPRSFA